MNRILLYLLMAFCLIGAVLSAFSLRAHYSTSTTEYCALDETFNCDYVNRSSYSKLLGVPVALIGLLGYLLLFGISFRRDRLFATFRFAASIVGLGFALYLTYIEAYVLLTWCLLCIGSLIAIATITILSGVGWFQLQSAGRQANS